MGIENKLFPQTNKCFQCFNYFYLSIYKVNKLTLAFTAGVV
jgi:hypothetical protein